ncbi:InlB B-repeat-containing protein, partial [Dysosmobacter sp.]|uniref:InlB B-repeat-containing protein n=1 Tax=Dysosmobacter sp. TaxID=2591382 RepID=UPI003AB596D7
KLTSEMATTEEDAEQNQYPHSLFVADYAVTHTISWDDLNTANLIFGKNYTAGGVSYTLRAPSVGSDSAGSGDSQHGTPQSNEWDRILDKNDGYIKNWSRMHSWGQDISRSSWTTRAFRGYISARYWTASWSESSRPSVGFRPVLEILNPGTLGSDGLKAVTLDLGGGKLGNSFKDIQIIVKKGSEFTAPASDGLTRPDGNADSYFQWLGSDGKLYAPGDSVPADVIKLTAQFDFKEQFTLAPGGVYYFDLSGVSIPGTANGSLPDKTMHYVPFTYAGTVVAYKLTSEMATTEEYAQQNEYAHSLFVADYAVTHAVSWDNLNAEGLIFGKGYATGSVDYTLRAPSGGSGGTGSGALERGTPQSNEWDRILDKDDGYIKNWRNIGSWGQDTLPNTLSNRVIRGQDDLPRTYAGANTTLSFPFLGFRPVLEVLNPGTLGSDGLKAVTLDLGGGKLGGSSDTIQIIVKTGESFTAPASEGLTRPDGNTGSYFEWLGSDGELYAPDDNVPADVTKLTAQFVPSSHSVTITTDTLPDGKVGEAYSQILTATGTTPITWSVENGGNLPAGLSLNKDTGEISGTPTAAGTSTFTVKATNSAGSDTKELSITITKAAPPSHEHNYGDWSKDGTNHWHECTDDDCPNREESITDKAAHVYDDDTDTTCNVCGYERTVTPPAPIEFTITVTSGGNGMASASHAKAVAGMEIRLTATPDKGYHLKEWQVISGGVTIKDDKFTMPSANVEVKAIFEKDTGGGGGGGYNPPVTYYTLRFETGGGSDIPSVQGTYNTYIDLTKYVPTWRGHTFIGWYSERSLMNKVSGVYLTKDMTVYAGWRVDENPGTGANPFTDVSEKDWFYGDVMFVYENGLMLGTSKALFSPHGTATRGM